MPLSPQAQSRLSEHFADILLTAQDEYRILLSDMRDPDVELEDFKQKATTLSHKLVRLKRMHLRLVRERQHVQRSPDSVA